MGHHRGNGGLLGEIGQRRACLCNGGLLGEIGQRRAGLPCGRCGGFRYRWRWCVRGYVRDHGKRLPHARHGQDARLGRVWRLVGTQQRPEGEPDGRAQRHRQRRIGLREGFGQIVQVVGLAQRVRKVRQYAGNGRQHATLFIAHHRPDRPRKRLQRLHERLEGWLIVATQPAAAQYHPGEQFAHTPELGFTALRGQPIERNDHPPMLRGSLGQAVGMLLFVTG